jgi:cytochrome c5
MNSRAWPAFITGAMCLFCVGRVSASEETVQLREAPGREVTTAFCATCHSLDYIEMNAEVFDRSGWEKSVRKMIDRFGAPIPEQDARTISDYLADNY